MRPSPGGRERNFQGLRAPGPLYGAYPAPNPGFTFVRTKVNRKSASPLWAGPRLFPNWTLPSFDTQLPLKFLFAAGSS